MWAVGWGDVPLTALLQSCRMAHLDRPYGDWPRAVTSTPANAMGLRRHCRIGVGLPADLVVFRGRRYSELLSRPQYDRVRDSYCISQPLLLLLLLLTVTWSMGRLEARSTCLPQRM